MPDSSTCPEAHDLRRLAFGQVGGAEAAELRAHLQGCGRCATLVRSLLSDETLVQSPAPQAPDGDRTVHLAAASSGPAPADDETVRLRPSSPNPADDEQTVAIPGTPPSTAGGPSAGEEDTVLFPPPADASDATQAIQTGPQTADTIAGKPRLPSALAGDFRDCLAPPQAPDEIGRLGGHRVLRILGAGSTGVTFEAEDPRLRRRVALKALRLPDPAAAEGCKQAIQQAVAAASASPEYLAAIHAVQEDRGVLFLVMPLLKGESLGTRLGRKGKVSPPEAVRIGREVAAGLAPAHERGLVHGSLRPGNVWLEPPLGRVKLLDFAVARVLDAHSGTVRGAEYTAPEQAGSGAVDARADLFALGAILFRTVTGQAPTPGGPPADPRALNPELPRPLADLILRLLARNAADRPSSARVVLDALAGIAADFEPHVTLDWAGKAPPTQGGARPATLTGERPPGGRSVPTATVPAVPRRSRRWLLLVAVALAALAAGALALWWLNSGPGGGDAPHTKGPTAAEGLRRDDIPRDVLAAAGEGDPNKAPPELVAVLGNRRVRFPAATLGGGEGERLAPAGDVAFSPDGKYLAATAEYRPDGKSGEVKLWDAKTGKLVREFRGHKDEVLALAFSPDGKHLASASADRTVKVWDVAAGTVEYALIWHKDAVNAVAFSPDGKRLVTGSSDQTVRVWDAATAKEETPIEDGLGRHGGPVRCVAFHPDGKRVASAGGDGQVKLWDLVGRQLRRSFLRPGVTVNGLAFTSDGKRLAAAGQDGTVKVWNVETGDETLDLPGHKGGALSVAWSADGSRLVATSAADQAVKVWDAAAGQELLTLKNPAEKSLRAVFSPDGLRVASIGEDSRVRLWDVAPGPETDPSRWHRGPVLAVAVSPDGAVVASGGTDKTVRLWDVAARKERHVLSRHTAPVRAVAFSPDGRLLASAGDDHKVEVWDAAAGTHVQTFAGHTGSVLAVAFADAGTVVSAGADGTLRVWDAATGQEKQPPRDDAPPITCLAISPDGKRLITAAGDRALKVWELSGGQPVATHQGHTQQVTALAFRPDGKAVASASLDQTVRLWELAEGKEARVLAGHTAAVTGVAFRPDGRQVASCGEDGTVRLWDGDADGPAAVIRLFPEGQGVNGLAYSPAGRHVVTANQDGTLYVLRLAPGK